jgi:hypothetical protein
MRVRIGPSISRSAPPVIAAVAAPVELMPPIDTASVSGVPLSVLPFEPATRATTVTATDPPPPTVASAAVAYWTPSPRLQTVPPGRGVLTTPGQAAGPDAKVGASRNTGVGASAAHPSRYSPVAVNGVDCSEIQSR